jgi:hypothetical protein
VKESNVWSIYFLALFAFKGNLRKMDQGKEDKCGEEKEERKELVLP